MTRNIDEEAGDDAVASGPAAARHATSPSRDDSRAGSRQPAIAPRRGAVAASLLLACVGAVAGMLVIVGGAVNAGDSLRGSSSGRSDVIDRPADAAHVVRPFELTLQPPRPTVATGGQAVGAVGVSGGAGSTAGSRGRGTGAAGGSATPGTRFTPIKGGTSAGGSDASTTPAPGGTKAPVVPVPSTPAVTPATTAPITPAPPIQVPAPGAGTGGAVVTVPPVGPVTVPPVDGNQLVPRLVADTVGRVTSVLGDALGTGAPAAPTGTPTPAPAPGPVPAPAPAMDPAASIGATVDALLGRS